MKINIAVILIAVSVCAFIFALFTLSSPKADLILVMANMTFTANPFDTRSITELANDEMNKQNLIRNIKIIASGIIGILSMIIAVVMILKSRKK